jgi:hypothetical protein
MKEHPILFSGEMVRAILDGRKTQTRRVVKKEWEKIEDCPYGKIGDRLWVRENFIKLNDESLIYRVDRMMKWPDGSWHQAAKDFKFKWKPSIHMPRYASRITLEITDVRVELLKAISNDDARAEGIPIDSEAVVWSYRQIWEAINGEGSWDKNPWVWAISFKMVK